MGSGPDLVHKRSTQPMDPLDAHFPKCTIGMDLLGGLQTPRISSLTCLVRMIVVRKAKWKTLNFPSSLAKIVNKTRIPCPGSVGKDSCYSQRPKQCRSSTYTLHSLTLSIPCWIPMDDRTTPYLNNGKL